MDLYGGKKEFRKALLKFYKECQVCMKKFYYSTYKYKTIKYMYIQFRFIA